MSDEDEDENHETTFNSQTFVPLLPTKLREDRAINEILNNKAQHNRNMRLDQPSNEILPVDEFNTPGYIARAFPTLYPWKIADLNEPWLREVKPAEYFKHLLIYFLLCQNRIYAI